MCAGSFLQSSFHASTKNVSQVGPLKISQCHQWRAPWIPKVGTHVGPNPWEAAQEAIILPWTPNVRKIVLAPKPLEAAQDAVIMHTLVGSAQNAVIWHTFRLRARDLCRRRRPNSQEVPSLGGKRELRHSTPSKKGWLRNLWFDILSLLGSLWCGS